MRDKELAEYINEQREKIGMTRDDFCQLAGVHKATYKNFMLGKPLKEENVDKICGVLDLPWVRRLIKAVDNGFTCKPPSSCFECPYPECKSTAKYSHDEMEYGACGHLGNIRYENVAYSIALKTKHKKWLM